MKILFLCVANSARSQMAEGLAKEIFADKAEVASAGSEPSGKVHPMAIEAMKQIKLDLSQHSSNAIVDLDSSFVDNLNYVITLCAEEVCPVLKSEATKLHWPHPDPAAAPEKEQLESFCKIRDQIKEKIEALAAKIS